MNEHEPLNADHDWYVSLTGPVSKRKYKAVHADRDCGELRKFAPAVAVVPTEFVQDFSPCARCSPVRWYPREPVSAGLGAWFRKAQASA